MTNRRSSGACGCTSSRHDEFEAERGKTWTSEEREEREAEVASEEDSEPTVEDDLDLAIALLVNRPLTQGDLRNPFTAAVAMAWTDQFDMLLERYERRKDALRSKEGRGD